MDLRSPLFFPLLAVDTLTHRSLIQATKISIRFGVHNYSTESLLNMAQSSWCDVLYLLPALFFITFYVNAFHPMTYIMHISFGLARYIIVCFTPVHHCGPHLEDNAETVFHKSHNTIWLANLFSAGRVWFAFASIVAHERPPIEPLDQR